MDAAMGQLIKYVVASVVALAADLLALFVGVHAFHMPALVGGAFGYLVGAVASYLIAVNWVFMHRIYGGSALLEAAIYLALGMIGLVVTEMILWVGVDVMALSLVFSKGVAIGCSFTANYFARCRVLFWCQKGFGEVSAT